MAIAKILDLVAHRVDSCIEHGTKIECIDTLLQWPRFEWHEDVSKLQKPQTVERPELAIQKNAHEFKM